MLLSLRVAMRVCQVSLNGKLTTAQLPALKTVTGDLQVHARPPFARAPPIETAAVRIAPSLPC